MKPKTKNPAIVTNEQLVGWLGSDCMNVPSLIDLLMEVINEEYLAEEFRKDVLRFDSENKEVAK